MDGQIWELTSGSNIGSGIFARGLTASTGLPPGDWCAVTWIFFCLQNFKDQVEVNILRRFQLNPQVRLGKDRLRM